MEWWFTLPWQIDGKVQGVLRHCFTSSNVGSTLIRAIFWAYLPETMTNKGLLTFHLSTFLAIHVVNISIKPSISRECGPPPIQLFKQRGAAQDWIKSHCLTSFRPLRTRQTPRKLRDKNIEKKQFRSHIYPHFSWIPGLFSLPCVRLRSFQSHSVASHDPPPGSSDSMPPGGCA